MLQIAWYEMNIDLELKAYTNLSIDYYYLGQIEKAKYYKERVLRCKSENNQSITRKVAVQILKSRIDQKVSMTGAQIKKQGKRDHNEGMPSPTIAANVG
jgi:hypothetical protein